MKTKVLEWDSSFFKKKIGEIEFEKSDEFLIGHEKFDLLYLKQVDDVFFEIDNFKQTFSETKVVFAKKISDINNKIDEFIRSDFDKESYIEQIYQLAYESGKFSRFKLDENFLEREFIELYKKWVDNSFIREFADSILIYVDQQKVLGFVTYNVFDNYATIGLIAIVPEMQGKGIGKKLIYAVENKLNDLMIDELRISTQIQNKNACSFYTKLGYNIKVKTIIKHYWRI
jgi:dTDP-4-amino-4,6-dideoxy-D-galactose acyltransferase